MTKKKSEKSLTAVEQSVIKALLNEGCQSQDIHALINVGRNASINFGRISEIKANNTIVPATKQEVAAFRHKKLLFDHRTSLCPITNERLVRAREAMILAVELFNTPRVVFKTGVFAMLVNVAWTYLLHEYYESSGVQIVKDDFSLLLSQMVTRDDCPLSKPCKQNLIALKKIRDVVEHRTIGQFDLKWLPLFQANCLNFESTLTTLFGAKLTLGHELGFSLQFAKLTTDQIATLQGFDVPEHIAALDASLADKLHGEDADDLDYQFRVVYTLTSASKAKSHFQFINPDSAEGKEIQNVLIKHKPAEDIWPLKHDEVVKLVEKKSGRKFNKDKHQRALRMYNIRPKANSVDISATDRMYCIYHPLFRSYTYSHAWVDFLCNEIADERRWTALSTFKDHNSKHPKAPPLTPPPHPAPPPDRR
jgi:hypothetical protein